MSSDTKKINPLAVTLAMMDVYDLAGGCGGILVRYGGAWGRPGHRHPGAADNVVNGMLRRSMCRVTKTAANLQIPVEVTMCAPGWSEACEISQRAQDAAVGPSAVRTVGPQEDLPLC